MTHVSTLFFFKVSFVILTFITIAAFLKSKYRQFDTDHSRGVARGGGARGTRAPQNLADQLTLFKPWGQIMPVTQPSRNVEFILQYVYNR